MSNQHARVLPRTMLELYGEQEAIKVLDRCYEVDDFFGAWVSEQIYGVLWELPPLNLLDKSLVTVISLIVLGKEEQLEIHLKGIFNLGKNTYFILNSLSYLRECGYLNASDKILEVLKRATNQTDEPQKIESVNNATLLNKMPLSSRDAALIKLSALVAIGDNEKTKDFIKELLLENTLSTEEIRAVFRHQMTYCGCPCTMNGFSLLNQAQIER